jgi:hypothetical protein
METKRQKRGRNDQYEAQTVLLKKNVAKWLQASGGKERMEDANGETALGKRGKIMREEDES